MSLKIPSEIINAQVGCEVCSFEDTPDMIFVHLIEDHEYKLADAETAIVQIAKNPYLMCPHHGEYHVADIESGKCPGCEMEEIQEERRFARMGGL